VHHSFTHLGLTSAEIGKLDIPLNWTSLVRIFHPITFIPRAILPILRLQNLIFSLSTMALWYFHGILPSFADEMTKNDLKARATHFFWASQKRSYPQSMTILISVFYKLLQVLRFVPTSNRRPMSLPARHDSDRRLPNGNRFGQFSHLFYSGNVHRACSIFSKSFHPRALELPQRKRWYWPPEVSREWKGALYPFQEVKSTLWRATLQRNYTGLIRSDLIVQSFVWLVPELEAIESSSIHA